MKKEPLVIYHNPRCAKSREALALINESGNEIKIIDYIKNPPTTAEIKTLLEQLNLKPFQLIRTKEEIFKNKFKGKTFSDAEWIKILSDYPILIERPIIVKGNKAIIGRPPQLVKDLF